MGDFGKVGISAGFAQFDNRNHGKVGLEGNLKGDFNNQNIGYKLSGNANALIGSGHGLNANAYAGVEFGKLNCTQFNLGVMADYTKSFDNNPIPIGDNTNIDVNDFKKNQSLKTGLELGYSKNLCCDEDRKLSFAVMGGAEFYGNPEINKEKNQLEYSNKLNKVKPFIGSKVEYAKTVNDKGHELYFTGKCYLSDASTYGEAGIGFRF